MRSARAWQRAAQSSPLGIELTASQSAGSAACRSQSAPSAREQPAHRVAAKLATCAPLVTWVIGTARRPCQGTSAATSRGRPHRGAGDAVSPMAHPDRQRRHPRGLVAVVGVDAAEAEELSSSSRAGRRGRRRPQELVGRVGLVASRNRRVGREHRPLADRGSASSRRHPARPAGRRARAGPGPGALVQVDDRRLDLSASSSRAPPMPRRPY